MTKSEILQYCFIKHCGIGINETQNMGLACLEAMDIYANLRTLSDEDINKEAIKRATNNVGYFNGTNFKWFKRGAIWVNELHTKI